MHEPDLETACVALANELIVQLRVPFPRIQCILEIGSTLFCSLFHILCGYLPVGIIEYPQSIDDERKNLDLILDKFSKDILDVELPHIKSDNIIVCDCEAIYYLLEIFKKYSLLFPPEQPPESRKDAGSEINYANFIEARQIDVSNEEEIILPDKSKNKILVQANALHKKPPIGPLKIPPRHHKPQTSQKEALNRRKKTNKHPEKPTTLYHSCPACPKTLHELRLSSGCGTDNPHCLNRNLTEYFNSSNTYSNFHQLPQQNYSSHLPQQSNTYSSLRSQTLSPEPSSWASHLSSGSITSSISSSGETIVEQSLSSSPEDGEDGDRQPSPPLDIQFRNLNPLGTSHQSENQFRRSPRSDSRHQKVSSCFDSQHRAPSPSYRVSSPSTESWYQEIPQPIENRYLTPSAPPESMLSTTWPLCDKVNRTQSAKSCQKSGMQSGSRHRTPVKRSGSGNQAPRSGCGCGTPSPRSGSRGEVSWPTSHEVQIRSTTPPSMKRVRFKGKQKDKGVKKKHEKRNWKDGVVLCAETYGFKIPAKDFSVSLKGNIKSMKLNYNSNDHFCEENGENKCCENRECGGSDTEDVVRKLLLSQLRAQINRAMVNSRKANYQRIQNFEKEEKIHSCQIKRYQDLLEERKGSRILREPSLLAENNPSKLSKFHVCPENHV